MVSKRLRYEVLRRDNYRCTYCGKTAKETELHVDHVIPKTLGGQDTPQNLTTACEPCNLGKSSTPADAEIIAAVELAVAAEQAAKHRASESLAKQANDLDTYEDTVWTIWEHHMPPGVKRWDYNRICEWFALGIPTSTIENALRIAIESPAKQQAIAAYSAGVIRNKFQEARDAAYQNDQT